jgi:membrane protease YdiL (CAAX protease family)
MSELLVGIWAGLALAMAAMLGVFSPRKINGPARLEEGESSTIFLTVGGAGLFVWGLTQMAAAAIYSRGGIPPKVSGEEQVAVAGVMDLAGLVAMAAATVMMRPKGIQRVGARMGQILPGLLGGILALAIVLPLIFWIQQGSELVWSALGKTHEPAHAMLMIWGNTQLIWLRVAIVVTTVVIAPLTEEMFFRGQFQTFLRYATGSPWLAVVIAALCFAGVHEWWTQPSIFFLGFCLGYLYERTGNLWACVVLHALFNLSSILIFAHYANG